MCEMCPWSSCCWKRPNIGRDIAETVLTNKICSSFETDQSQTFAVLCALWALSSQLNPIDSFSSCLGLRLGL